MKKAFGFLFGLAFLVLSTGVTQAALTTIGTAQFGGIGTTYNLIWDDDNNGKSLVWLDYTHQATTRQNRVNWAVELNFPGSLTYNIDPGYTVNWGTNIWRLPATVDGPYVWDYTGKATAGYNITSSEMGHLYYTELGNLGYYSTTGVYQPGCGLKNKGEFKNLVESGYWSGTEYAHYPDIAWYFSMDYGYQGSNGGSGTDYGLAVREGQVSTVPVPGAFWLLGSGLIGIVDLSRRKG